MSLLIYRVKEIKKCLTAFLHRITTVISTVTTIYGGIVLKILTDVWCIVKIVLVDIVATTNSAPHLSFSFFLSLLYTVPEKQHLSAPRTRVVIQPFFLKAVPSRMFFFFYLEKVSDADTGPRRVAWVSPRCPDVSMSAGVSEGILLSSLRRTCFLPSHSSRPPTHSSSCYRIHTETMAHTLGTYQAGTNTHTYTHTPLIRNKQRTRRLHCLFQGNLCGNGAGQTVTYYFSSVQQVLLRHPHELFW